MSFIPLTELLNMNALSVKMKADKDTEEYKMLNKIYKKNKDPNVKNLMKNLMKKYENEAKESIKSFEISKKLVEDNIEEIKKMRKKNQKIFI
jgi:ABC-type phosphate/phosphonate transport system substrate-binding protein